MKKSNKKGFTIVELVIVIAVIAILAAVLIPTFTNVVNKANESKDIQQARNAYEEWLAKQIDKDFNIETVNLCITSGTHTYHVVNGQFLTDATHNDSETGFDKKTVSNGELVART
mgnify:CR=1 FL=1